MPILKHILLGYRPYDFKDEKTGRQVQGVSLFTQFQALRTTGYETVKISVPKVPANIEDYLGAELNVDFDQNGKVLNIEYPSCVSAGGSSAGGRK